MCDNNGNLKCTPLPLNDRHQFPVITEEPYLAGSTANLSPRVTSTLTLRDLPSPNLPAFEMITSPSSNISSTTPSPMSITSLPSFGVPGIDDSMNNNNNNNNNTTTQRSTMTTSSSVTTSNPPIMTLPEILEGITKSEHFPTVRYRWNTNEEIAALLISMERHEDWLSQEVRIRPKSGSTMLYSRKRVRYRRDGYCWKKRKDGKTTREDHMKLKVQGIECIYGCYVHSAILPTFHRRCYWLLQNPDIVLVHYLNVPYNDDNKMVSPSLNFFADTKKEWTREELISELKPMFLSETEELNPTIEKSTVGTIESIVQQLMMRQRSKLHRALEDNNGNDTTRKLTMTTVPHHQMTHQTLQIISTTTTTTQTIQQQQQPQQPQLRPKVNMVTTKRDALDSRATSGVGKVEETGTDVNGNAVGREGAGQANGCAGQQGTTLQLLQLTSPASGMCQLNGVTQSGASPIDPAPATGQPTSLILSLSQLQAATASGQSFFILNSTTGNQTVAVNSTQLSTPNGAPNSQGAAPVTFIYGRTNDGNQTKLLCTSNSGAQLGKCSLTGSQIESFMAGTNAESMVRVPATNNGNTNSGTIFRTTQPATIKTEPIDDDVEMTTVTNNKRFNLDENEEKMICSEPSSPERFLNNLGSSSFLTEEPDPDYLTTEPTSTKDEHFDAFDSLFGTDSNLIPSSCHISQNDPNFTNYSSSHQVKPDSFETGNHTHHPTMIIHHRGGSSSHSGPGDPPGARDVNLNQMHSNSPQFETNDSNDPVENCPIDDFMESEELPGSDDILFSLDTFDIFSDFVDHLLEPSDLGAGTHTNGCSSPGSGSRLNLSTNQRNEGDHSEDSTGTAALHSNCAYSNAAYQCTASLDSLTSSRLSSQNPLNTNQIPANPPLHVPFSSSQLTNYKGNHADGQLSTGTGNKSDRLDSTLLIAGTLNHPNSLIENGVAKSGIQERRPINVTNANSAAVQHASGAVQQAVTVTMDENGNLQLVKSESAPLIGFSTTRRAASAGHASRTALSLHELNTSHKSSDSTLNDIADTDEFGLFQNGSGYGTQSHQPRRQRHLSDIHTYSHRQPEVAQQQQQPLESSSTRTDPNGNSPESTQETAATIADYSPEWCYPEGGIKVLVAGPWYSSESVHYSIQFDGVSVPTQLVQTGLLRCFSPKHEPGFVTLAVVCNNVLISNSVIFEYRAHAEQVSQQTTPDYFSFDENLFRTTLLERCDKLTRASSTTSGVSSGSSELLKQFLMDTTTGNQSQPSAVHHLEATLVNLFDILDKNAVSFHTSVVTHDLLSDLSLLHLASALNMPLLVSQMLCAHKKAKVHLAIEIDPQQGDQHGNTALAWAVALGHCQVVASFFASHSETLIDQSQSGAQTLLSIAQQRGQTQMVQLLGELTQVHTDKRDKASEQKTVIENVTPIDDPEKFVSSLEFDEKENQLDLQSLDDLIHYLEQHELDSIYQHSSSGQNSLTSQDSIESLDTPGTPTLMLSYRDVIQSPSNSSPSSEYSLESLESLESFPTTSPIDLCEYFKNTTKEFKNLKLNEQKELYEAAETIQKAYRMYKDRKVESAAITIQSYYRRYKQYLSYFPMSKSRKSLQDSIDHHSDAKRFKTAYGETDDDEVDEGMFTGTNSSDISMTNSTAQSDDEDSGSGPIRSNEFDVGFCGESFSDDESELNANSLRTLKMNFEVQGRRGSAGVSKRNIR